MFLYYYYDEWNKQDLLTFKSLQCEFPSIESCVEKLLGESHFEAPHVMLISRDGCDSVFIRYACTVGPGTSIQVLCMAYKLLGYRLSCPSDAQVMTGFDLVTRTQLKRATRGTPPLGRCLRDPNLRKQNCFCFCNRDRHGLTAIFFVTKLKSFSLA